MSFSLSQCGESKTSCWKASAESEIMNAQHFLAWYGMVNISIFVSNLSWIQIKYPKLSSCMCGMGSNTFRNGLQKSHMIFQCDTSFFLHSISFLWFEQLLPKHIDIKCTNNRWFWHFVHCNIWKCNMLLICYLR